MASGGLVEAEAAETDSLVGMSLLYRYSVYIESVEGGRTVIEPLSEIDPYAIGTLLPRTAHAERNPKGEVEAYTELYTASFDFASRSLS